ncbi:hypothetical protein GIB67_031363 [Kingdonia uniflora]|uniref:Uncharacterized protein n=1 Tax=Kingdonia uniflora TaxID=39325 RepID=A0A7J7MAX7_9MAGN|nr:hypothetical protein GIB67_031363 [Kingdonia uniflora]
MEQHIVLYLNERRLNVTSIKPTTPSHKRQIKVLIISTYWCPKPRHAIILPFPFRSVCEHQRPLSVA